MIIPRSTTRAVFVLIVCVFAALGAFYIVGWSEWTQTWFGVHFKQGSGAVAGLLWSRYIARIDISKISFPEDSARELELKTRAGLAVAMYVCTGAIGVPLGA